MNEIVQSIVPRRDPRNDLIQQLQHQLGRVETAQDCATSATDVEIFSSGAPALDRLLPGGGLRHGMLVEWLAEPTGSGAVTLSLLAAREACRQGGMLVVIDRERTFYPRAAAAWGIDLARLVVVHPQTARDALWAAVQSLRSPAVAAMWIAVDRLDDRAFRRLQLAAGSGHTLGLLVRPAKVRGQPSWADVQISTEQGAGSRELLHAPCSLLPALNRLVHLHLTRSRGGRPGGHATLEIDDATHTVREATSTHDAHPLPVVTELADPAAATLPARA